MKSLQGHRAVVTGASSGIGQEYARQLASLGCDLVIVARRLDRLKELAKELQTQHRIHIECVELDLLAPNSAKTLFERATASNAQVSILISNAGIGQYGNFIDFPLEDHLSTLRLNSVVPTELTHYFLKHMITHGRKSFITHVASIAAFQPTGFFTVYSGTKGYLRYFSETLGFEIRKTNVSLTCTCPGGTYTEFMANSGQKITRSGHFAMMNSKDVVRTSLNAMFKGKSVFVPGIINKLACFLPRLLPRSLSLSLAFITMNRAVEREVQKPKLALKS